MYMKIYSIIYSKWAKKYIVIDITTGLMQSAWKNVNEAKKVALDLNRHITVS